MAEMLATSPFPSILPDAGLVNGAGEGTVGATVGVTARGGVTAGGVVGVTVEAAVGGVFGRKASNTLFGRYGTKPVARQAARIFRRIVIRACR